MWIDATIAASFLTVDGVAYAQSPNAGNPVGANWLWAWAMAVPAGSPNSEGSVSKMYALMVSCPEFRGFQDNPTLFYRWRRSRRQLRKTGAARIAARPARYHAAGHEVFAVISASAAVARSMPRPARHCRGSTIRSAG